MGGVGGVSRHGEAGPRDADVGRLTLNAAWTKQEDNCFRQPPAPPPPHSKTLQKVLILHCAWKRGAKKAKNMWTSLAGFSHQAISRPSTMVAEKAWGYEFTQME